ncbi:MAG TPA: helix-turn-helix domain-containing protein [Candidatus Limnocylindrales bacterium]
MTADRSAALVAAADALSAAADALRAIAQAGEPDGGPDRLWSVEEAAEACGVGRSLIYTEIASGRLRSLKVGRRRLVPSGAIAEFIAEARP